MGSKANLVAWKLRLMADQVKFLEAAWNSLSQEQKDRVINNYVGRVPMKYSGD